MKAVYLNKTNKYTYSQHHVKWGKILKAFPKDKNQDKGVHTTHSYSI